MKDGIRTVPAVNPAPWPRLLPEDFVRFSRLIEKRTGIRFEKRRARQLSRGLFEAAARAGCEELDSFYSRLNSAASSSDAWNDLMVELTVGETYFFRDTGQMLALEKHILPAVIEKNREKKTLRLWSAGCATGEEPYTLAILLCEILPDIARWDVSILATDINIKVLDLARQGRFREWSFRETDPDIRRRYFTAGQGGHLLVPRIRDMVHFTQLNLMENTYPSPVNRTQALDLILCRNVVIYFAATLQPKVMDSLARCLTPDGWLLLSAAESAGLVIPGLKPQVFEGAVVYRKKESPFPQGLQRSRPGLAADKASPARKTWGHKPRRIFAAGPPQNNEAPVEPALPAAAPAQAPCDKASGEELFRQCQKVLAENPLCPHSHFTLGLLNAEQGRTAEAVRCFKQALYADRDFLMAHVSLMQVFAGAGQNKLALHHGKLARRLLADMTEKTLIPGASGETADTLLHFVDACLTRKAL
jgi:chemotaxis protein methyltransferase CheR